MRTIITQTTFHGKGSYASCRLAACVPTEYMHTLDRNITAGPVHTKLLRVML